MILATITQHVPAASATAKEWHEWKNASLTTSMQCFLQRHPWFSFKKQDLFQNLSRFCNVPSIYAITRPGMNAKDVFDGNDLVVFKRSIGHSSKEVRVLRRSVSSDSYDCLLTRSSVTLADLQAWIDTTECIVEQALTTFQEPIPFDFKCYLVDGVVKYVGVINRNGPKTSLAYFYADSLDQLPFSKIFSAIPSVWSEGFPPYSEELKLRMRLAKAEAERIAFQALDVRGLLVSLDMYVTPMESSFKVWLGEITPRPGALHSNWLTRSFIHSLLDLSNKAD